MKIRIQDSSIRYRLTLREVEILRADRYLERHTEVFNADGPPAVFRYSLAISDDAAESRVSLEPNHIRTILTRADAETLADPAQEGVYLRREWIDSAGLTRRFMAFVEKDRPGGTCVKPEAWIYEQQGASVVETRPIPKAVPT